MIESVLQLYKELGETPLECLERFRTDNPDYKDLPMTYAGRLDPMAEGLLLILAGEECKKKDEYLGLDKEYIFEVLFGVKTDTYDVLGIPELCEPKSFEPQNFVGKKIQKYPPYSSRTFQMAREGIEFELPTKDIEVYSLKHLEEREISARQGLTEILEKIDLVKGDFRQTEIKSTWCNLLENSDRVFKVAKFKISCSSGTYVRSIANEMGSLAYSIKRTRVGEYSL